MVGHPLKSVSRSFHFVHLPASGKARQFNPFGDVEEAVDKEESLPSSITAVGDSRSSSKADGALQSMMIEQDRYAQGIISGPVGEILSGKKVHRHSNDINGLHFQIVYKVSISLYDIFHHII